MHPSFPSSSRPLAPIDARCVMCEAPLTAPRTKQSLLCMSAVCAGRYAMLRPHEKCVECTRPLTWQQQAAKVCDDPHCRQARLVWRPMAAAREAYEKLQAVAEAKRNRALAARGVPKAEWRAWPVALVPKFRARESRLPRVRREAFADGLREHVKGARARFAVGERVTLSELAASAPPLTPREEAVYAVLGATCGACRGSCCKGGSNHGYLREHAMLAYMQRFPEASDDDILAHYVSFIPERTLTDGCVYQRVDGCSLPRDMRSDICNRYFCSGLLSIRDCYGDDAPIQTYVAHREGREITSGRFLPVLPG